MGADVIDVKDDDDHGRGDVIGVKGNDVTVGADLIDWADPSSYGEEASVGCNAFICGWTAFCSLLSFLGEVADLETGLMCESLFLLLIFSLLTF